MPPTELAFSLDDSGFRIALAVISLLLVLAAVACLRIQSKRTQIPLLGYLAGVLAAGLAMAIFAVV